MKRLVAVAAVLATLILAFSPSFAQPPAVLWEMTSESEYANWPQVVQSTPDGDVVIGLEFVSRGQQGSFTSHAVVGMTADGASTWVRVSTISDVYYNRLNDTRVAPNGEIWVCGHMYRGFSVTYYPYYYKLDPEGSLTSQTILPLWRDGIRRMAFAVQPQAGGGAMMLGWWDDHGDQMGLIGRVSDDGTLLWLQGDRSFEWDAELIPFGENFLIGGTLEANINEAGLYFESFDQDGNTLWQQQYVHEEYEKVFGLAEAVDGGFVVLTEPVELGYIHLEYHLLFHDSTGQLLSDVVLPNFYQSRAHPWGDRFRSSPLVQMVDGGYLIGGRTANDVNSLVRTDPTGTVLWETSFDHNEAATSAINDIVVFPDGRIQCVGVKFDAEDRPTSWFFQLAAEGDLVDGGPVEMRPFELEMDE